MFSFQKTRIWPPLRELTKQVYLLVNEFPKQEDFGLKPQIKRAIVSVSVNLAEGTTRNPVKDQALYYKYAYGSLAEVYAGMLIAESLGYVQNIEISHLEMEIENIARQLNGLRRHHLRKG